MSSLICRTLMLFFLSLALLSSCASNKDAPVGQWIEMEFVIDGRVDIKLAVPPGKAEPELLGPQFVSTSIESFPTLFFASYDPGWGRNRGLLLTRFASSITRIQRKSSKESPLSTEDIKNDVYLARDDAIKKFDIVGEVLFNDRPWLRVNLIGGYRRGISYATLVDGGYVLILGMSIFGEESDQTNLFPVRHETLKKIVNSVRITTE